VASPTTGEDFYSGDWEDIKAVCSVLNIGSGKLAQITQASIEYYQEMVDREIDDVLSETYHVPLRHFNQYQPDGTTKSLFPGSITKLARYWTAGLLLLNQFQSLDTNTNESATNYIEESRRELFKISRFQQRLLGQIFKSNISRTMPPTMQPPFQIEPDF
jgi:hypothetical protein